MFRMGLTPKQIAKACDVPSSKVSRVLGWTKRRDPHLAEEHAANARDGDKKSTAPVSVQWAARFEELLRFTSASGRLPYTNVADPVEASLGRWLARQRYALSKSALDLERQRRLDAVADWRQPARSQRDKARWDNHLVDVVEYASESERLPSYRNYADDRERQLGTWLHAQRQQAFAGKMADQKRAVIDTALPGWYTWGRRT